MQILSNLSLYGTLGLNSVADANTDTDKFLVIDSNGIVKYRTGQELYNDIGAGGVAAYTSKLQHEVKAGVALTKGQAVYVTSADGTNMIVGKASNASEPTSSKTLGLLVQDLAINDIGFVVTEGLIAGLDTSTALAGDPVWLGTDGNLLFGLSNKPHAPAHMVFIGIVTRVQQNNGEIFVKVQNGFELQELHNVQITSTPSDNAVLAYETSTSLYKMKSISTLLGYTPVTNARNITINGTTYDLSADRSWSVGTHTGNLTTGYVPKATGTTTLTDSLIYDNGSAIGINTNSPYESSAFKLDVNGGVIIKNTSGTAAQLILINSNPATGGNNGFVQLSAGGNTDTAFGQWQTYYGMSVASGALRLQPAGGQVLIGTTTTSAFTTDINGTLRVSGQLTLGSTISNNTYVYTMPGASGTLALVSQIPSLSGYVQTSRTLTINGVSYDLSADRSWTIAAGVSSVQAGSGISVSTSGGIVTVSNTITNTNQLTNGAGYITGYTETDTLASVTARGASTSSAITVNDFTTTTGYIRSNNPIYNLTVSGSAQNVWGKRILLSEDYYGNDGLIPYGSGLDKTTVWVHDYAASRKHGIVVSADNNGEAHFYAVDFANSSGSSTIGGSAGGWGFNLYYDGVGTDPFNLRIGQAGTWTHALKISFARDVQWQNLNSFTINGNAALHAGNYNSYALPLSGGTMSGSINMAGTQIILSNGFAGIEYHNTSGQWEGYVGTESGSGQLRYNSRQGNHTWYSNSSQAMKLNSGGTLDIYRIRAGGNLHDYEASEGVIRMANNQSNHNYIVSNGAGWGSWNQWIRYVAGYNTWRIGTFDAAQESGESVWRLAGRNRSSNAEVNYIVAGPRGAWGSSDRVILWNPYARYDGGSYNGDGTHYKILDASNYNSYALPLSGGTLSNTLNIGSGGSANASLLNITGGTHNQVNITNGSGWGLLLGYCNEGSVSGYHGPNSAALINVQDGPLHLGTGNTPRVTVLGNGNVTFNGSIGLAVTADVRLSVNGDAHISNYLYMGGTAGSVGSWGVRALSSGGNWTVNANSFTFDNVGYGGTWSFTISGGNAQASSSMRAPIFYDSDDTGYYADFNSTSNSAIRVRGGMLMGPNPTWGAYLQVGGNGSTNSSAASVVATNGNLHLDSATGFGTYINHYYGGRIYFGSGGAEGGTYTHSTFSAAGNLYLGGGGTDASYRLHVNGTGYATSDFRAPIFYDSDNTGYYGDFASTSNLNYLVANYIGVGQTVNTSYRIITSGDYYANAGGNFWAEGRFKQYRGSGTWHDVIDSGNIGSQSVNYANYSGYADRIQTGNNQWNWSNGAHTATNPNTVTLWDQYSNYGGSGNPTAYGTILDIYGRSAHEHDQLYFSYDGQLLHRNCFYGTNSWSGWRTILNDSQHGYAARMNQDVRASDNVEFNQVSIRAALYVGTWGNSSDIYMTDGDEGTRRIHCNSNRVGFLNQSSSWGAYCDDTGNWVTDFDMYCNTLNTGNTINIGYTRNNESVATSSFRGLEFHAPGNRDYYLGKPAGGWTQPLHVHFYTGIWLRSHQAYGGIRFYNIAYDSQLFSVGDGSDKVNVYTNQYNDGGIYFKRGGSDYSTFIRAQNHPDQGYGGSDAKYWLELGSYGGVHVTLNMDGGAGSGENGFDHFTIWQTAANSSSGSRQFYVTNIGNVWARNDITAFSDIRVKENIRPIENALQKVVNSRGVMYDRIDTGEKNGIGFIAQELETQIPDLVKTDDKGFKSVKYQNMVAILTEAIKEQQKQIEELKGQLNGITK